MKILHIISSGGMYGAEAVILNLSRALHEREHLCVLGVFLNSSNPNLQLHETAVREGVESHLIPCNGQFDRSAIASIRELASKTGADIVHAHGYKADIFVYLALHKSGIPTVSTCHNWIDSDWKVKLYGVVDRLILRYYIRIIAVSEEVRKRLLNAGVMTAKISMIRNGVDLTAFDNTTGSLKAELGWNELLLVGFVGRLSMEKGADIFLHMIARVFEKLPNVRFVLAGDGPDRAHLEALIDSLGIRRSVRVLGRREDIPNVLASLDVLVSSSRQEGLPISILEGMASRLAIIATAVGEVPILIQNERTGLLVPSADANLLAEAIIELSQNPAKRRELGLAARQLVEEEYSATRMANDYLRIYEEAVAVSTRGRANE